ncbi:TPA: integron-associated HEPN domain-containing protein [Haemophilus influenzae]|uniref:integron-associated HEPN domain-containing protein n=1 Tax=Haemophilus influenzae TaxID=727 RepID=UPI0013AED658|nr:integron-associated HEPN domain-containing protein [Haemophilus influenzae]MCK8814900.1 integron-associated HEPN domain-containing protein [Haemophilus influenzae]MDO7260053.1 integron-associated HEPN domain-containing protein [Haemophilus influenzae]
MGRDEKMTNKSNLDDKKSINFYFYLQDCILDIGAACSILKGISEGSNKEAVIRTTKMCLGVVLLNVCRISEAIRSNQAIVKELSEGTRNELNKFVKNYHSDNLKKYRNTYLVHSNEKNRIPNMDELGNLLLDIIFEKTGKRGKIGAIDYIRAFDTREKIYNRLNHLILCDVKNDIKTLFQMNDDSELNRYSGI